MNRFFIITNMIKDPDQSTTQHIVSFLRGHGAKADFLVRDTLSKEEMAESGNPNPLFIPPDTQCIIVLGGDGTLLQAARDTLRLGIPLVGVNLGTLGFLAEVEKAGLDEALLNLLNDEYEIEERMLLTGSLWQGDKCIFEGHALNDIVISRRGPLMVLPVDIVVNGQPLASYKADGIIVSTPTGSTGYNLSAGGPIVTPKAQLMVLTPICPHTMNTRSVILSPEDEVLLILGGNDKSQNAEVNFDGGLPGQVRIGDRIFIRRSGESTKLIRLSSESFLKLLHNKMK